MGKETTYKCDKCGEKIYTTYYEISIYAGDVNGGINTEAAFQNITTNFQNKHYYFCKDCRNNILR